MNAKPRSSKRSGLAAALIAAVVLLIGYVLSYGPVFRLMVTGTLPAKPVATFYAPINWVSDVFPPLNAAQQWYIELWMPDDWRSGIPD